LKVYQVTIKNMIDDEIRRMVEQIDPDNKISQDKMEELIIAIKDIENSKRQGSDKVLKIQNNLKEQMEAETDWRKKASIAAKIISLELE